MTAMNEWNLAEAVKRGIVQEMANMEDNGQVVHDVLDRCSYESLPESTKIFVLTNKYYVAEDFSLCDPYYLYHSEWSIESKWDSVWEYIISLDMLECMKALLSRTPLYAVNKENIPSDIPWTESAAWMQNILLGETARLNSDVVCD